MWGVVWVGGEGRGLKWGLGSVGCEVGVRVGCEKSGWRLSLCWACIARRLFALLGVELGEGRLEAGWRRQVQTLTKDDEDAQDEEDSSDSEASDPQGVVICGQSRRRVTNREEYSMQREEREGKGQI